DLLPVREHMVPAGLWRERRLLPRGGRPVRRERPTMTRFGRTKEAPMRTRPLWLDLFTPFSTRALFAMLPLTLALGVAASATTATGPKTEALLSQAGFRQMPADPPQKVAHMQTLPDRRLIARNYKGKKYYVSSDPEGCKCISPGTPAQYQTYRSIARQ